MHRISDSMQSVVATVLFSVFPRPLLINVLFALSSRVVPWRPDALLSGRRSCRIFVTLTYRRHASRRSRGTRGILMKENCKGRSSKVYSIREYFESRT